MANMNNFFGMKNTGKSTVADGYDTKSRDIVKLGDATEQRVYGFIISKEGKTKKGKTLPRKVLLCGEEALVSLPGRYTAIYEEYGEEQIQLLKSGRVFLRNITPIETANGETYIFDLETDD